MGPSMLIQAVLALALFAGSFSPLGGTPWPTVELESLPPEIRSVLELVPQLNVDGNGYLFQFNPDRSGWEENPLTSAGLPDWKSAELTGGFGQISWVVVLQHPNPRIENDLYTSAHFAVTEDSITQTKAPGTEGIPQVVWQLPPVNWEAYNISGQPYVYSAATVSRDPRFRGIGDSLTEIYEARTTLYRRAVVVKVDGNADANLVGLLWSLKQYRITPWQIWDNEEIYGHNRDAIRDLGPENVAKVRYYLGILALTRGSEEDKELYFGPFLGEDGDRQAAVENYFASIREYLMRILTPAEIQAWDADTGYWFWRDILSPPDVEMPIATDFVLPIPDELRSPGGYRHLKEEFERGTLKGRGTYHIGEDFNIGSGNDDLGEPFGAIAAGRVVYTGRVYNGMGNLIIIRHRLSNGAEIYSRYAHLNEIFVVVDQAVQAGEIIGTIGRTGRENDPDFYAHLHLDLAYAVTYERYMLRTPGYYPNESQDSVQRSFIDLSEFIEQEEEAKQAREIQ